MTISDCTVIGWITFYRSLKFTTGWLSSAILPKMPHRSLISIIIFKLWILYNIICIIYWLKYISLSTAVMQTKLTSIFKPYFSKISDFEIYQNFEVISEMTPAFFNGCLNCLKLYVKCNLFYCSLYLLTSNVWKAFLV